MKYIQIIVVWFVLMALYTLFQWVYAQDIVKTGNFYSNLAFFLTMQLIVSALAVISYKKFTKRNTMLVNTEPTVKKANIKRFLYGAFVLGAPLIIYCLLYIIPAKSLPANALSEKVEIITLFYRLAVCFGIGISEESLCRLLLGAELRDVLSVAQKNARSVKPELLAAFVSSAVFGIWHLVNIFMLGSSPEYAMGQVLYTGCIGLFLAAVLFRSHNFAAVVLLHTLLDFASVNEVSYSVISVVKSAFSTVTSPIAVGFFLYLPLAAIGVFLLCRADDK